MSISITKYIDITSGAGGAAAVANRLLIGRYVTTSSALLPGEVANFSDLDAVGVRFSANSPEYVAASKYFAFVSKITTSAPSLSMARWAKTSTPPTIAGETGITGSAPLAAIQAATTIGFNVTDATGTVTPVTLVGIDMSSAVSFAAVASILQTALRANANLQLANASVLYTAANGQFTIAGAIAGAGGLLTCVEQPTSTTDLGVQLGLLASLGAVSTPGINAQTAVQAIDASVQTDNDFGSFGFIDSTSTPPTPLAQADVVAVSQWTDAQNNTYLYCLPTSQQEASVLFPVLEGYSGVAMTLSLQDGQDFAEFCPMEILAATDYTRANASTDYMFYQFANRTATVTDTTTSDSLDAVRCNYVGQVQQAGQKVAFYQRGVLMGGQRAATDQNTFANEMWLKDDITTRILNAFLTLPRIPATNTGRAILLGNVQASVNQAITNGTISVGKILTTAQQQFVTQVTNDPNAWQQVQNIGYWLNVTIVPTVTPDGRTEYKAVYVLVYSTDAQVRSVTGSDILI